WHRNHDDALSELDRSVAVARRQGARSARDDREGSSSESGGTFLEAGHHPAAWGVALETRSRATSGTGLPRGYRSRPKDRSQGLGVARRDEPRQDVDKTRRYPSGARAPFC